MDRLRAGEETRVSTEGFCSSGAREGADDVDDNEDRAVSMQADAAGWETLAARIDEEEGIAIARSWGAMLVQVLAQLLLLCTIYYITTLRLWIVDKKRGLLRPIMFLFLIWTRFNTHTHTYTHRFRV
jgi:hypothetical protein